MHAVHYLGCALLPLLIFAGLRTWQRRERWLLAVAAGAFMVSLAPPVLLALWKVTPLMGHIRHLFRFYPHHWQVMVVLLAGTGLDALLLGKLSEPVRARFVFLSKGLGAVLGVLLVAGVALPALSCNLPFVLFTLIATGIVARMATPPGGRAVTTCAALLLLVTFTDLTRYFWEINLKDARFTQRHLGVRAPLPDSLRRRLASAWSKPTLARGFEAGVLDNLPVVNSFWPRNRYLVAQYFLDAQAAETVCGPASLAAGEPLEFCTHALVAENPAHALAILAEHRQAVCQRQVVLLHEPPGNVPAPRGRALPGHAPARMTSTLRNWTYNDSEFEVAVPQNGWLVIHQLYDPRWVIRVDDVRVQPVRANFAGMAVPVPQGRHLLKLEYRPQARGLYPWASLLFEFTLAACAVNAVRNRQAARHIACEPSKERMPFELRTSPAEHWAA
jgi:hypothetical protein